MIAQERIGARVGGAGVDGGVKRLRVKGLRLYCNKVGSGRGDDGGDMVQAFNQQIVLQFAKSLFWWPELKQLHG